jgi:hypothetical protein
VSDEDIREMWPDYVPPEKSSETYLDEQDSPHDSTRPLYNDDQPSATQPKHRELVCFQWWEREQYYRFQDIDGQIKSISAEQAQSLQERMTALGMPMPQMVKQTKKVYNKAYMVGGTVLESMPLEVQSGFTLHLITGARDRNNNTWFGLVALMMDPQRWANKWLSQIMHILNSSAKGGLIAERDAFAKTADAEASWAKAETITWANPGAVSGGKIQPKPTTAMPDGFAKLLDFAVNSINDVPGVNMELMGLVGTNQPGVLENMRKQAGMTILAIDPRSWQGRGAIHPADPRRIGEGVRCSRGRSADLAEQQRARLRHDDAVGSRVAELGHSAYAGLAGVQPAPGCAGAEVAAVHQGEQTSPARTPSADAADATSDPGDTAGRAEARTGKLPAQDRCHGRGLPHQRAEQGGPGTGCGQS